MPQRMLYVSLPILAIVVVNWNFCMYRNGNDVEWKRNLQILENRRGEDLVYFMPSEAN